MTDELLLVVGEAGASCPGGGSWSTVVLALKVGREVGSPSRARVNKGPVTSDIRHYAYVLPN